MKQFIKREQIDFNSCKTLLSIDAENKELHLTLDNLEVREKLSRLLAELSPLDQKKEKILGFYVVKTKQSQRRLLLQTHILFNGACLHPVAKKKKQFGYDIETCINVSLYCSGHGYFNQSQAAYI